MAVCHTVIPEKKPDGTLVYYAASPDEQALIYGAEKYGYVFQARTPTHCIIKVLGKTKSYEILHVLEFTSTRKRMSVVVKTPKGEIKLYCKGADTVILERLSKEGRRYQETTLRFLDNFAREGLRTLCCAMSNISKEMYNEWKDIYLKASTALTNREKKVEDAANLIEINLKLIGSTAIEDKLQEGVPEAIETLLNAGINLWVLTGDKQETAINIGYSSKLLSQGMELIILNEETLDVSFLAKML